MMPIIKDITGMNAIEKAFSVRLQLQQERGEIVAWRFEPQKFILSHGIPKKRKEVSYKPDFLIVEAERFVYVEVKAKNKKWTSMRDDARAKVNIAAGMFPWFKWIVAYNEKGVWSFEHLN